MTMCGQVYLSLNLSKDFKYSISFKQMFTFIMGTCVEYSDHFKLGFVTIGQVRPR